MIFQYSRKLNPRLQYLFAIGLVLVTALVFFPLRGLTGYQLVALVLLLEVSILAVLFGIGPVLISATCSALVWNFFFIPPLFTFHIEKPEDLLLFFLYFFIALINSVFTYQIRLAEAKAMDKKEKENAIALYRTLFNSLSHELRTPIANVIGAVDTLRENEKELKEEQKKELLNQIAGSGQRLKRQVENLLHMSRVESGMIQPKAEWTDISELIYQCVDKVDSPTLQILVEAEENLPLCKLDAGLTEQILHNLLENSIAHSGSKSGIVLRAGVVNSISFFEVQDFGKGISEEQQAHIFEKFYRLPDSKPGGSGLGLSIARGFAEAQGGSLNVKSALGKGTTFRLEIPVETNFVNLLKNE